MAFAAPEPERAEFLARGGRTVVAQAFSRIVKRRSLAGAALGGRPETQQVRDGCAEQGIVADIEMIRADDIDEADERMLESDAKHRFVIDNASLAA